MVAQQQLELGRAEVLRKQLADLDDRIVAYEKLAASFETPKGGGGGSGVVGVGGGWRCVGGGVGGILPRVHG